MQTSNSRQARYESLQTSKRLYRVQLAKNLRAGKDIICWQDDSDGLAEMQMVLSFHDDQFHLIDQINCNGGGSPKDWNETILGWKKARWLLRQFTWK